MKRTLLTGTTAIALIAGLGVGFAQAPGGGTGGGAAGPQMQRDSSPGTSGTSPGSGGRDMLQRGQTQREGGPGMRQGQRDGADTKRGPRDDTTGTMQGQRDGADTKRGPREDAGPRQGQREDMKRGQRDDADTRRGQRDDTTGQRDDMKRGQRDDADTRRGERDRDRTGGREGSRERATDTTGAAPASVTTEQRTRIRERRGSLSAGRVTTVNFTVAVGTVVPQTIEVYELPPAIVEIVPEYRGYRYILVEDEVLIIDPNTMRIVAIIEV